MKRWCACCWTVLLLTACMVPCRAADFADVPETAWYAETVAAVSDAGWMTGTAAGQFSPDAPVTMAQAVESIYRCLGSPGRTDRPDTFWYSASQDWLRELDLTLQNRPLTTKLTREEMAFLLYHSYCSVAEDPIYNAGFHYSDNDQVNDYYYWVLKFAYSTELLNGDSRAALHPKDPMTRAELATVLLRLEELLAKAQAGETEPETMELNVEVIGGSTGFQVSLLDINYQELENHTAESGLAQRMQVPVGRSYLSAEGLDGTWEMPITPLRVVVDRDAVPSLQVVPLPTQDTYRPSCQLNLTVPDRSPRTLRLYAEPMDGGQWIRVTAFLLPEAADVAPVTAQTHSGDTEAAAAPFLRWLQEHAPETAAQMTEYSLEYDEMGDLVFLPRGHFGGILPGTLEGLVQDRATGAITARRFAWRQQGGYRACVETVELKSKDGLIAHIPAEYDGITADPEQWDDPPMLFVGRIQSEWEGLYFSIFREPLSQCSLPTYDPDKPWPTETYRFQVLGIDDNYGYFLWRPTDMQYDYHNPTETALYQERFNMAEFITDDFVSANQLVANPRWMFQLDGYQEGNLSALRALLSSVLTTGDRAYFTIPPQYPFSAPGEDYGAWNIVLEGKRHGRTVKLDLPERGWEDEQTYRVDRGQWDSVTLRASLPGTPELFVKLF